MGRATKQAKRTGQGGYFWWICCRLVNEVSFDSSVAEVCGVNAAFGWLSLRIDFTAQLSQSKIEQTRNSNSHRLFKCRMKE
jgi:hypothetical protein